jgi:hypothetical protein
MCLSIRISCISGFAIDANEPEEGKRELGEEILVRV